MPTRGWTLRATLLLALYLAGCGRLAIYAGNTVTTGEQDTFLPALVERGNGFFAHRLANVEVSFFAGGSEIARALTDEVGFAVTSGRIPNGVTTLEVRATVDGHALSAKSEVWSWQPGRTTIVCDVDGTISQSDLGTLVYTVMGHTDIPSAAVPDAAQTLQRLAKDYNIIYLTDRPIYLRQVSYKWMSEHGFPPGPLITTPDLHTSQEVVKFKQKIIGKLKTLYPDTLIGFGNAETDAEAYAASGMLSIMIDDGKNRQFGADVLYLRTWKRVGEFFSENGEVLRKPGRLRAAMTEGRLQLQGDTYGQRK